MPYLAGLLQANLESCIGLNIKCSHQDIAYVLLGHERCPCEEKQTESDADALSSHVAVKWMVRNLRTNIFEQWARALTLAKWHFQV